MKKYEVARLETKLYSYLLFLGFVVFFTFLDGSCFSSSSELLAPV